MTKKHVIWTFALLFGIQIYAQDVFYGAKVGGNVSHFLYQGENPFYSDYSKMKVSVHLGGFVEYFLDDYFALQPELLFNIKGASFEYPDSIDARSRYVMKYLSLPILVKYYATKKISIAVGPEVSYLLEAKEILSHPGVQTNYGDESASVNLYDYYKPYDIGITAGAGYVFDSGIYLDLRYTIGMMNTFKSSEISDKLRNGVIQFSAGFSLNY